MDNTQAGKKMDLQNSLKIGDTIESQIPKIEWDGENFIKQKDVRIFTIMRIVKSGVYYTTQTNQQGFLSQEQLRSFQLVAEKKETCICDICGREYTPKNIIRSCCSKDNKIKMEAGKQ